MGPKKAKEGFPEEATPNGTAGGQAGDRRQERESRRPGRGTGCAGPGGGGKPGDRDAEAEVHGQAGERGASCREGAKRAEWGWRAGRWGGRDSGARAGAAGGCGREGPRTLGWAHPQGTGKPGKLRAGEGQDSSACLTARGEGAPGHREGRRAPPPAPEGMAVAGTLEPITWKTDGREASGSQLCSEHTRPSRLFLTLPRPSPGRDACPRGSSPSPTRS